MGTVVGNCNNCRPEVSPAVAVAIYTAYSSTVIQTQGGSGTASIAERFRHSQGNRIFILGSNMIIRK